MLSGALFLIASRLFLILSLSLHLHHESLSCLSYIHRHLSAAVVNIGVAATNSLLSSLLFVCLS